jgi:hypothetical protein
VGETLKGCEKVKLSRKLALTLRVASTMALGAALVPILASPAEAQLTITAAPTPSSVTLGATPTTLTDTATLSGGYYPTGSITFTLHDPSSNVVDTETATVNGNGSYSTPTGYTLPTTGTVIGTYQWDASYSGDTDNAGSSDNNDASEQVTVSSASPLLTTTPNPTSVNLGTAPTSLKDTATLSGGYDPTGSITFKLYNPSSNVVDTETATVNGNGSYSTPTGYTLPTTGTVIGTYQWDASYSGDTDNAGSSDASEQVTVSSASPLLTTAPTPSSVTLGATPTTLTDTATLLGGYYPTGSITFTLHDPSNNVVDTETATVNGNGSYSTPTGYTPTTGTVDGTYQWNASYSGDTSNAGSSDNGAGEQVAVSGSIFTPPPPTTITQTAPFTNSTTLAKQRVVHRHADDDG